MESTDSKGSRRLSSFPTGAFIAIVAAVCLGLAVSAIYDYVNLAGLRVKILQDSAARIAYDIDGMMRGPAIRSNANAWQGQFAETVGARGSEVAFLALLDESGQVIASEGDRFAPVFTGPVGFVSSQGTSLYIRDAPLAMGRGGMGKGPGMGPGMMSGRGPGMGVAIEHRAAATRLRVGIYTSSADTIRWRAIVHLAMNGVAIITLLALSRFFLRTLNRFLQLKAREESARHLTALGAMAATLAHEIRNPLGAMKGLTQLAQEDLPGDHKTQSLMRTVVREAERLEQLVTDLLTFARPKDPQISRFDLAALLSDIKTGLQPKLEENHVMMEIEPPADGLVIDSDESGLRQILLNALLNATDSLPGGGKISVRARREDKDRRLVVEIDDSGAGLAGRDSEELFQPFTTTKAKGTGLGLPISRQIAQRLGGTLDLTSRPEGGARCTLNLPLRRSK